VKCKVANGRFVSPFEYKRNTFSALYDELLWKLSNKSGGLAIPAHVRLSYHMNHPLFDKNFQQVTRERASVTWLGHASCMIQVDGKQILTDPVWSKRPSPVQWLGPSRYCNPPIEVPSCIFLDFLSCKRLIFPVTDEQIEDLKIDIVLISHTHYDHLDYATAMRIGNNAKW
jgi:hypothetical protein